MGLTNRKINLTVMVRLPLFLVMVKLLLLLVVRVLMVNA